MFYAKTVVEDRNNKVAYYTNRGYEISGDAVDADRLRVICMEKEL